jgi:hypothetical protein
MQTFTESEDLSYRSHPPIELAEEGVVKLGRFARNNRPNYASRGPHRPPSRDPVGAPLSPARHGAWRVLFPCHSREEEVGEVDPSPNPELESGEDRNDDGG